MRLLHPSKSLLFLSLLLNITFYLNAQTITSVSPKTGTVGTTVTINGTGFGATVSNNVVYVGGVKATITSANSTQLKITAPTSASSGDIQVVNLNASTSARLANAFSFTYTSIANENNLSQFFRNNNSSNIGPLTDAQFAYSLGSGQKMSYGDFNNDGKIDFVTLGGVNDLNLHIYKNIGIADENISSSTFHSKTLKMLETGWVAPGRVLSINQDPIDLNMDGLLDLVIGGNGYMLVLINTSSGAEISFSISQMETNLEHTRIRFSDFNKDGKPEIVTAGTLNREGINIFFLNFTSTTTLTFTQTVVLGATAFDFDIIEVNSTTTDVMIQSQPSVNFAGTGSYGITRFRITRNPTTNVLTGNNTTLKSINFQSPNREVLNILGSILTADLDNDGDKDLIYITHINSSSTASLIEVVTNLGNGNYAAPIGLNAFTAATKLYPGTLKVADINGDGKLDILIAGGTNTGVEVLLNNYTSGPLASSHFKWSSSGSSVFTTPSVSGTVFADFNQDGKIDLIHNSKGSGVNDGSRLLYFYTYRSLPVINSPATLTDLTQCGVNSPSKYILIDGTDLDTAISISNQDRVNNYFLFSLNDTNYFSSISLLPVKRTLQSTKVYVKMSSSNNGTFFNKYFISSGITVKNFIVSGTRTGPTIVGSDASLDTTISRSQFSLPYSTASPIPGLVYSIPQSNIPGFVPIIDAPIAAASGRLTIPIPNTTPVGNYSLQFFAKEIATGCVTLTQNLTLSIFSPFPSAPIINSVQSGSGQVTIAFTPGANNGSSISNYQYSIDGGNTWITRTPASISSPIVIPGLTNGSTYTILLRAVNTKGPGSSATVTATPAAPPSAPTALTVTPGNQQLTIAFTPGANNGSEITNYQYSLDGRTYIAFNPAVTGSPVTVTGLTNGTVYSIYLRAVNGKGSGAPNNVSGIPIGAPFPPTSLTAISLNGGARISFTQTSNGGSPITNYEYSLDDGVTWLAFNPVSTGTSVTVPGLTNGTNYSIRLRALNAFGASAASQVVTITPGAPDPPINLQGLAGNKQITVSFTPGSDNGSAITEYQYSLYAGGSWGPYISLNPKAITSPINITGLTNGIPYSVRLRAVNAAGVSANSIPIGPFTPADVPAPPTSLLPTAGNAQVTIGFTAGANGGSAIINYEYTLDGGTTWIAFTPSRTISPLSITGLTNGTNYTIQLRARNAIGASTPSVSVNATPAAAPAAPTQLVATPGDRQITLNFVPAVDNGKPVTNYQYSLNGSANWISINPTVTSGPIIITGLVNGTMYSIQLRAVNVIGAGLASSTVTAIPGLPPQPPVNLVATPGNNQISISFTAGSNNGNNITNYQYSLDGGLTWISLNPARAISPSTITNLTNGQNYTIQLRAVNAIGPSAASLPVSATPTPPPAAPAGLSYTTPNIFLLGSSITDITPAVSGGVVTNYTISPALPAGLTMNASTGIINGSPTTVSTQRNYTVTATNAGGSTTSAVSIAVVTVLPPSSLSYTSPNSFVLGTTIANLTPTVSGGAVSNYSSSPALPAGLTLNAVTGVISGTPTAASTQRNYTITAKNAGGSTSFVLAITVTYPPAPSALSYTTPNSFLLGRAITNLVPTVVGKVDSYAISPALPAGLTLNASTGEISGTPTTISTQRSYTITARNTGGTTTATISLGVISVTAPSGLTYTTPNNYIVGNAISPLNPTVSGDAVTSYNISPLLPSGLSLNTITGVISGTPTNASTATNYTVTATNAAGSTSATISISVANATPPSSLSYTTPQTYKLGNPISNLIPTVSGGAVTSYSITPALPAGLVLNATTGIISGTPSASSPVTTYTITATNSGGSTTASIDVNVITAVAPSGLSYTSPQVFTINGNPISNVTPTLTGDPATFNISPSLPAGLTLNTSTGVISGTPTAVSPARDYSITATNAGGNEVATVNIAVVNDAPPNALSYNTPNTFNLGNPIVALTPTVSGGTVTSYSIAPALPSGLSINNSTGAISGTPTAVSAATNYTITASNSGGASTATVSIEVVLIVAPSALSYTTPNSFSIGSPITNLSPTITGSPALYSVSPALPTGLSLNTTNGVISGTPTVANAATNYTVTATNASGSTNATVSIAVLPQAITSLSYTTPNSFQLGTAIANLTPTVNGGVATSYSVSPALPTGLSLNTTTGVISGSPGATSAATNYVVTAINGAGSVNTTISIAVSSTIPTITSFTPQQAIPGASVTITGTNFSNQSANNVVFFGATKATVTAASSTSVTVTVPYGAKYAPISLVNLDNGLSATSAGIFNPIFTPTKTHPITFDDVKYYSSNKNKSASVELSDLDGDGKSDILFVNFESGSGSVLVVRRNTGIFGVIDVSSNFANPQEFVTGSTPFALAVGDLDGDGKQDVAVANYGGNSISVFRNTSTTGNISFAPKVDYPTTGNGPTSIAIQDLDGDGKADIVTADQTSHWVSIFKNASTTGTISFNRQAGLSTGTVTGPVSVKLGDLNGDDKPDLVVVGKSSNRVTIFRNTSTINTISFETPITNYTTGTSPYSVAIGDLDGDGKADLAVSNESSRTISLYKNTTSSAASITFVAQGATTALGSGKPSIVAMGDLDGDGKTDLAVSMFETQNVATYGNTSTIGTISFSSANIIQSSIASGAGNGPQSIAMGDIDGDGLPDIVSSNFGGGSTALGILRNFLLVPRLNGLSYPTPNTFTVNGPSVNLTPTLLEGRASSYSITPSLPSGLVFNTTTGVISGVPTQVDQARTYTVTAVNTRGSINATILITVGAQSSTTLSYTTPNTFTAGTAIADLTPTVTGGVASGFSVSPALPTGLSLNASTGVISGTPIAALSPTDFTVTATIAGASVSTTVNIRVVTLTAPTSLQFTSPNTFTVGTAIANLTPTVSGGTPTTYSVSPALPAGLSLHPTTGVISGTPTAEVAQANYTITGTNTIGSTTTTISIQVVSTAISSLSYTTPNSFVVGNAIANLNPTLTGGVATSYSVSPALPSGLLLNSSTGVISGTPTITKAQANYIITASNSAGSRTATIAISVIQATAPASVSYSTPNTFYVDGRAITSLSPTVSGGIVNGYNITPALPTGLSFDNATGVISGTPTIISPQTTYTITATNSAGVSTTTISIQIQAPAAPAGLSYTSPPVYTVGSIITNLTPTVSGGNVTSYSVSPALPAGLNLNASSGVISGTPSVTSNPTDYTITALNIGGSATAVVSISVVAAPAPSSLSYISPSSFSVGTAIVNLVPSVTGVVTNYSISPALPAGLSLNTSSGVISGTPTAASQQTTYTITASNSGGNTTATLSITVSNAVIPSALSYTNSNSFQVGIPINNLVPTVSGGPVVGYSINPALPAGLTLNTSTGIISGTPVATRAQQTYTVTAYNSGGSTSATFTIVISLPAVPASLRYNTPNTFVVSGNAITDLTPSVTGLISNYSVSPALPLGLNLHTSTGVISGTPTAAATQTNYTITATNSGGSTSTTVSITVNNAPAPTGVSYTTNNIFSTGFAINDLNPTVTGGTVSSYSIAPSLPAGLILNASTGVISGTPLSALSQTSYTVTATNSGGSVTASLSITINATLAPASLSYTTPKVFRVNGQNIPVIRPTSTGGAINTYSINATLPKGLQFNTTNGEISGIPEEATAQADYIVSAVNSAGVVTATVTITVINDVAPSGLSYPLNPPNVFILGTAIQNVIPTYSGGSSTFTISPSLPNGLSMDPATGIISGTPLVINTQTDYTITATNSGGSTSFVIPITVNDVAPSGLTYPTDPPNVFTIGGTIPKIVPSVNGGSGTYTVSPSLPPGLSLDPVTGVISGTPTTEVPLTNFVITVTNGSGSSSFTIGIKINKDAPNSLSYLTPNSFIKNTAITPLLPNVSGGAVASYSISPDLPNGLLFNTTTGEINGTPSIFSLKTAYTITATNSGGSANAVIDIEVRDLPPNNLVYPSPNNLILSGSPIDVLQPTSSGGLIASYSISPSLPQGLSLNTTTGIISGIPTVETESIRYTVTGENLSGSVSTSFTIKIQKDIPPSSFNYLVSLPLTFTVGKTITNIAPNISGGSVRFSVRPSLPNGLVLDSVTGLISGTPISAVALTDYMVTASGSGGVLEFSLSIAVVDVPPSNLTYPLVNSFVRGTPISNLVPSVSGGGVTKYTASPSLPLGLTLDSLTGIISGVPLLPYDSPFECIISAINSGGETQTTIVFNIKDIPLYSLLYSTPSILTKGKQISNLNPEVSGGFPISYRVEPSLPSGLTLDTINGIISGIPKELASLKDYTITASNDIDSISATIEIKVIEAPPANLSYTPAIQSVTFGIAIPSLVPSSTGGSIESFSIAPALPSGLVLDPVTGVISGSLNVIQSGEQTYVITGVNISGSTTAEVKLIFNTAPSNFDLDVKSVSENQPGGSKVGIFSVTDPDQGDTHSYTLVSGAGDEDNASFTIDKDTLRTNGVFDFEKKARYSVRVRVTDAGGLSFEQVFMITVIDLDEDSDGDGVMDSRERLDGTNVMDPCSLKLESQTITPSTQWLNGDCNGDGIKNGQQLVVTMYATKPQLLTDGTLNFKYVTTVRNLRPESMDLNRIQNNLANAFVGQTSFKVSGIKASGTLVAANNYDGRTQTNKIASGSKIRGYSKDSVVVDVNVSPNGFVGIVNTTAVVEGTGTFSLPNIVSSTDTTLSTNGQIMPGGLPTKVEIPKVDYFIPDGFSPNRDGINDYFVVIRPFQAIVSIEVFNRWGNIVYKNSNYNNDWDGRAMPQNGSGDVPVGTYFYIITAKEVNGQVGQFKGSITLKR